MENPIKQIIKQNNNLLKKKMIGNIPRDDPLN